MRAAVLHDPSKPMRIEADWPDPVPGPGEVKVKVAACGLCRTDLHYIKGLPTAQKPPIILGHEISGTVAELGSGVKQWKIGDRILIPPVFACGVCEYCRSGRGTICAKQTMVGNHRDGGFAEFICVPASDIFHLPEPIPLEEGCVISDAISTPYHAVVNRGKVQPGEWVLVLGCGGVGLSTVQMSALAGGSVIAVDIDDAKLELASKVGAVATINSKKLDLGDIPDEQKPKALAKALPKAVKKISGGGGVDVAFEVIGRPETIQQAFNSLRWGARLVTVGYSGKPAMLAVGKIMFCEMTVLGSLGCGLQDYPRLIELVRSGNLNLKDMVTHRFTLDELNKGFDKLAANEPGMVRGICVME